MKSKRLKIIFWIMMLLYFASFGYYIAGLVGEVPGHSAVYGIAFIGMIVGMSWVFIYDSGHDAGYDKGRTDQNHEWELIFKNSNVARDIYFKAIMEISDWDNYNLGGDPKTHEWHPAKVAEAALEEVKHL